MPETRYPFPFLVGSERSGTTLFRLMLDAHPDMAIPPESYFIVDLYRRRKRYECKGQRYNTVAVANDLAGSKWFRAWGMPPRSSPPPCAVRTTWTSRRPCGRCTGATPGCTASRGTATRPPPTSSTSGCSRTSSPRRRFVHLIRDGRNVALSLTEVKWGPSEVLDAALQWRERVLRGRQAGAEIGARRYLEVRYERLVDDPEAVLREVSEFLELPFDEAMLRHSETAAERVPGRADGLHRRAATAPAAVRDWRQDMAREDLEAVEAGIGELLTELGYERAVPDPPRQARRRVQVAASRRARRHLVRRLKFFAKGNRRL